MIVFELIIGFFALRTMTRYQAYRSVLGKIPRERSVNHNWRKMKLKNSTKRSQDRTSAVLDQKSCPGAKMVYCCAFFAYFIASPVSSTFDAIP